MNSDLAPPAGNPVRGPLPASQAPGTCALRHHQQIFPPEHCSRSPDSLALPHPEPNPRPHKAGTLQAPLPSSHSWMFPEAAEEICPFGFGGGPCRWSATPFSGLVGVEGGGSCQSLFLSHSQAEDTMTSAPSLALPWPPALLPALLSSPLIILTLLPPLR